MTHSVYVIYKDGEPMKGHEAGIKRNAFDKIGSAKSVVSSLVTDHVHYSLRVWRSDGPNYFEEQEKKERARYEVVEYVPKEVTKCSNNNR